MFQNLWFARFYNKISQKIPENIKRALIQVLYAIFEKFYDLLELKWYSCDLKGIQCLSCKRAKICDVMLKIYLLIIWL
jgi:hypothetical protein